MAECRYLAEPHPHWVDFPNNLPPNTIIHGMTRDRRPIEEEEGLDVEDLENEVLSPADGKPIVLRHYRQSEISLSPYPLVIYMHGGGFVTGGLETDDRLCRSLVRALTITVVSVEYRLAPEFKFPAGFQDCLEVIKWAISPAGQKRLNVDISLGWVLGGTSAGGNFTSALAHTMLEQSLQPSPTGLLFMASSFCHPDVRPEHIRDRILSVDEINDAPGLTRKSIFYFAKKYGAPKDDVRYSPLLHASRKGLARRAFFQICGWDPRRDEAFVYAGLLEEEGIVTKTKAYKGLPHGFWTTCPWLPESCKAVSDTVEGVRWLLALP